MAQRKTRWHYWPISFGWVRGSCGEVQWHGWPVAGSGMNPDGTPTDCGWTLHVGSLKIYFGRLRRTTMFVQYKASCESHARKGQAVHPMPSDYNEAEEAERQRRQAERLAEQAEEQADQDRAEYRNKWERQTGKPCKPPGRPAGLPTSPPPPRKRGCDE